MNEFIKDSLTRALKTMCQTAVSMLTVGQAFTDVDWLNVVSVSVVAGIISLLMSGATGKPMEEEVQYV